MDLRDVTKDYKRQTTGGPGQKYGGVVARRPKIQRLSQVFILLVVWKRYARSQLTCLHANKEKCQESGLDEKIWSWMNIFYSATWKVMGKAA